LPFRKTDWRKEIGEKILEDCIQKIREKRIKKEKGELQKRIKEVDQQREDKRLGPLLKQKLELARQREKGLQKDAFANVGGEVHGEGGKIKEVEQLINRKGRKGF